MSRISRLTVLLTVVLYGTAPNLVAGAELIDYTAALSTYLNESNSGGMTVQLPTPFSEGAMTTAPANSAAQAMASGTPPLPSTTATPVASSTPARSSQFATPAGGIVQPNLSQAIATEAPTFSNPVTPASGVNVPIGTVPQAPSTLAALAPQTPEMRGSSETPIVPASPETAGTAPTFLGMPVQQQASGIVEQDGKLFYLEPVYGDGVASGGGEVPCGPCGEILGDGGGCCQQCCSSLCSCRECAFPVWLRADFLTFGIKGNYVPALLTRSPAGTAGTDIGVLGRPTTETVYGADRIGNDLRIGGRFRGGMWLNNCRKFGIDGEYFYLGEDDDNVRVTSDETDYFARPFINTNPAVTAEDAEILVAPRIARSDFRIDSSSEIHSGAAAFRWNAYCCDGVNCCCETNSTRVDLLAGYRYFRFDESIEFFESFEPSGGFFAPDTNYEFYDLFETQNEFHGAELGLNYMTQRCRWILDASARLGIGNMRSRCRVDGYSRVIIPGALDASVPGGFLTAGSRLGSYERNSFALLPQAEINLGYCVTPGLRFHIGYNFMYLDSVIRPGRLIPTQIDSANFLTDSTQTAGDTGPDKAAIEEGVWLQGISFGATYNF